jgi:hypothetical protein
VREAAEDLSHADSRLWRTLYALLARPGALTREFLDGHRVRYLPPLRLYLVISLVFFLLWELEPRLRPVQTALPGSTAAQSRTAQTSGQRVIWDARDPWKVTPIAPERAQALCKQMVESEWWLQLAGPRAVPTCLKVVADGGVTLREAFFHNLARGMFVLLPLLALFPMLLYWHPRRYYVEHLLFFVHNHAFGFLIVSLDMAVAALLPFAAVGTALDTVVSAYIPWYLYRSMRRVYGQGRARTLAKLFVLALVYIFISGLTALGAALYSFLTL